MSVAALKVPPQYPVGTNLSAYRDTGAAPAGPPAIPAIETRAVDANSVVTFTTLSPGTSYWAGAAISGVYLYFFFTAPTTGTTLITVGDLAYDPATQAELDAAQALDIPAVGVQAGTTGAPTPKTVWKFQPVDAAKGPFQLVIGGASFNGTWDTVLYLGYNVADGGSRVLTSEPSFRWAIEQDYNDGTKHTVESYFEYVSPDGSQQRRPIFWQINRATGAIVTEHKADILTFSDWATGANMFLFSLGNAYMPRVTGAVNSFSILAAAGQQSAFHMEYNQLPALDIVPTNQSDISFEVNGHGTFYLFDRRAAIGVEDNGAAFTALDSGGGNVFVSRDGPGSQTGDHYRATNNAGSTIYSRFNATGHFMTRKNAAPSDGDLSAGEMALWYDSTNGASKLMVKAKQADGTVKTASVALA